MVKASTLAHYIKNLGHSLHSSKRFLITDIETKRSREEEMKVLNQVLEIKVLSLTIFLKFYLFYNSSRYANLFIYIIFHFSKFIYHCTLHKSTTSCQYETQTL